MTAVGTQLTSVLKVETINATALSIDVFNADGGTALNAFQVKLFSNNSSPGIIWFDTANEWTDPTDGSAIEGVSKGTDPTTLPAGANMSFILSSLGDGIKSFHAIEFLASVAAGETDVVIHVGRA